MTINCVYKCRMTALGYTKEQIARLAGCEVSDIEKFINEEYVDTLIYVRIKKTIDDEYRSMTSLDHYKTRIVELALKLSIEEDKDWALNDISHMMIELGKMQSELIGLYSKDYRK